MVRVSCSGMIVRGRPVVVIRMIVPDVLVDVQRRHHGRGHGQGLNEHECDNPAHGSSLLRRKRPALPQVPRGRTHSPAAGSVIENVAPRSELFAADIVPPWRSMMERQIERPIPSPSGLLVMKGSKIASSCSAAIPVLLS
jgi:hypothetical protein